MEPSELFVLDELPLLPGPESGRGGVAGARRPAFDGPSQGLCRPPPAPTRRHARPILWARLGASPLAVRRSRTALASTRPVAILFGCSFWFSIWNGCAAGRSRWNQFHGGLKPVEFAPGSGSPEGRTVASVSGRSADGVPGAGEVGRYASSGPLPNGLRQEHQGRPNELSRSRLPRSGVVMKTSLRIWWPRSNSSRRTGPFFSPDIPWGGDFAYAVADQLSKRGRRISALLVLDTDAEPYNSGPPPERRGFVERFSTLVSPCRQSRLGGRWRKRY